MWRLSAPEKLIVALPYWNKKLKEREIIWQDALTRLSPIFSKPLPQNAENSLFISFDKDWNAQWVESKNNKSALLKFLTFGFNNQITNGVKSLLMKKRLFLPSPFHFRNNWLLYFNLDGLVNCCSFRNNALRHFLLLLQGRFYLLITHF